MTAESFLNDKVRLFAGDMLAVLPTLAENSMDSAVTDPPYHLTSIVQRFGNENSAPINNADEKMGRNGPYHRASVGFMGKKWDGGDIAFDAETWRQVYRVLKPGAHLVAFGGTRTYHRMASAIEDAGFEIRDTIMWLYGSGFPKSHDVSKGIDRAAEAKRERLAPHGRSIGTNNTRIAQGYRDNPVNEGYYTAPATEAAALWEGWGTALKPAVENIVCARKPLDLQVLATTLVQTIVGLSCQLPSLASAAGRNSPSSLSVFGTDAERGSAQWDAVLKCNTLDDLSVLTVTLRSESETPSSLSTVLSWLNILAEVLSLGSTFTTEMKTSLITDLQTLNFLLSRSTPAIIIEAAIQTNGIGSNVSPVASLFNVVAARLNCIRALSVAEIAISKDVLSDIRPNVEPIVLARKPLGEGTVAANVLRWGCGVLNIDGCRVRVDEWAQEEDRWCSCAGRAANSAKHATSGTGASTATKNAARISNESLGRVRDDIGTMDIGCSVGSKTGNIDDNSNIDGCGKRPTDQSLKDSKFTTSTGASQTTGSQICGLCGKLSIEPSAGLNTLLGKNDLRQTPQGREPAGREGEPSANRRYSESGSTNFAATPGPRGGSAAGRWPANLLHDGSEEVVAAFPETSAVGHYPKNTGGIGTDTGIYHGAAGRPQAERWTNDSGSAARFFYTAKADSDDRLGSKHPTVKPLDLMQWLVRLVTPKGGHVLDPFAGTGTTGEAAWREGFAATLIEREAEYQRDIRRRMALALSSPDERARESIKARGLVADAGPLFGGLT